MSFITEINHQLTAVEQSVKKYKYDASYQSYLLIAQYYRLLLYYKVDTSHKALGYLFEILEPEEHLLFGNIGSICYTNYYFNLKLCFYKDELIANTVDLENDNLSRMTIDVQDKLTSTSFYSYQMLLSYYKGQYLSAVNKSIAFYKDISLVKHIRLSVDFKLLEAVIRFKNNDKQEALQLTKYAQRHIRQIGKENCLYAHYLTLFLLI